jgi:hypothetical protein
MNSARAFSTKILMGNYFFALNLFKIYFMATSQNIYDSPQFKKLLKNVNFDNGRIGLYQMKLEAMLEVIMHNQAKLIANLEQNDTSSVFTRMEERVKKNMQKSFKFLKEG